MLPGDDGVMGDVGAEEGTMSPEAMTLSSAAVTPLTGGGDPDASAGEFGCDERIALPSSDSASKSSGGRRSFSISDLRLHNCGV